MKRRCRVVSTLIRIPEIQSWNVDLENGHPDWGFPQLLRKTVGQYRELNHGLFRSHPFQFISPTHLIFRRNKRRLWATGIAVWWSKNMSSRPVSPLAFTVLKLSFFLAGDQPCRDGVSITFRRLSLFPSSGTYMSDGLTLYSSPKSCSLRPVFTFGKNISLSGRDAHHKRVWWPEQGQSPKRWIPSPSPDKISFLTQGNIP
jgi:hypothetical protein